MLFKSLCTLAAVAVAANAATIDISVGEDRTITFNPSSVTAEVGDVLAFHFYSGTGGHSVVSSTLDSPCVPDASSFFSGYIAGNDQGDQTYEVTVNSTDPIWFYCSLSRHCQNGMVGVVNPPAGTQLSAYQSAAAAVAAASAPGDPVGGVLTSLAPSSTGSASSTGTGTGTATDATATSSRTSSGTAASTSTNAAGQVFGEMTTVVTFVVAGGVAALMA